MSHHRASSRGFSQVRTREGLPRVTQTKEGTLILCPFCTPTHPIVPGEPTPCGTELRLTAVQTVIPSRIARIQKITCVKCKATGGGEMVRYMNGFVHLEDCTPGTNLLRTPPKYTPWAKLVFKMPKVLQNRVTRLTGEPQPVREINRDGTETGKILGYIFLKGSANAPRPTTEPATE